MSRFNKDKLEVLPADGVIYPPWTVVFLRGRVGVQRAAAGNEKA